MIKNLVAILLCIFLFMGLVNATCRYLDRPYLAKSYATKQCAYIELANGERISCDNYNVKNKYISVWVK